MRLWAYQAVAHGADLISFFRWRSCRWGREQYWHGILYHHGVPQRRYDEARQLGGELATLSQALDGTTVAAEAAILFDYDSLWAFETQPHTGDGFDYREMATAWNAALGRLGVPSDLVGPDADLGHYKLLIAPSVHVCTPALADRLVAYVRGGGTLVLGPRSGVKDAENAVVDALLPGLLRPLAGCVVEEYDAFNQVPGLELRVRGAGGDAERRVHGLAEVLVPDAGAEITLAYCNHYYAGRPAAVVNRVGTGRCYYVGTVLGADAMRGFLVPVLGTCGIAAMPELPEPVEVCVRGKDTARYAFVLNHADTPVVVRLAVRGVDLLSGRVVDGEVALEPFGAGVYALCANGEC
jgi:beta-galactosidase